MEKKTNEKKVLVLSFLGVITLIAVVVGATFAYFAAQSGGTGNINVNANTGTTDNLSFQVGEAISLTANQEDFGQGTGNKSGSTYARAILTANNTTNTATRNYYLYFNILNNNFEYTTGDEQAEILLKVTNPDGTEVTNIPGLTRKTSGSGENEVTGFDITTKTGSITIADNYEITASPSATQEWQIEVIFVNLDSDQNANTGKSFSANLIIREDSPIGITNVSTSNITSNSITLTVDAESENTITKYYYAKNEEEYIESDSNTYTFSGLDAATSYTLKVYAVDDEGYQSAVYSTEETTADPTLADACPDGGNLASCIQTYYTTYNEGTGGLYYHDGVGTYTNADQEAGDGSYRYAGANPNNYVCFGSDEETCPADNLYRIIGVFGNQVKLIKHDYAGQSVLGTAQHGSTTPNATYYKGSLSSIPYYYWSGSSSNTSNTWSSSTLNTSILNGTYLNTLGSKWSNLIATTSWKVGGNTTSNIYNVPVKSAYENEIVSPAESTTYSAKVGLMYVSDYGYAASPENWNTDLYDYDNDTNRDNNWMYMGAYEWTISRSSDDTNDAFYVNISGIVSSYYGVIDRDGVRPSFYLESSVEFSSGDGTIDSPYRIQAGA